MLRLTSIAALMLVLLVPAAQAQGEQRGVRDPQNRSELRDQRDLRERFGQRVQRDRGESQDQRDIRDRLGQRDRRDGSELGDRRGSGQRAEPRSGSRGQPRGSNLVYLGEKRVQQVGDKDTIIIDQSESWFQRRRFRALYFFVDDNDIEFGSVTIKYMNGYVGATQNINEIVERGRRYRLPLEDPVSFMREIQMVYRSNPQIPVQARVTVYGEAELITPPGRDEWVRFECEPVSVLGKNHLGIDVGRRQGRFRSLRLQALLEDLEVWELKVHYFNGPPEEIFFYPYILANEYTEELDLRGNDRSIIRVELTVRSAIRPVDIVLGYEARQPHVCIEGLQYVPGDLLRGSPQGPAGPSGGPPGAAPPTRAPTTN